MFIACAPQALNYQVTQRMSDTPQLVVEVHNTQRTRKQILTADAGCTIPVRLAHMHLDDKLKRIGHSLSIFDVYRFRVPLTLWYPLMVRTFAVPCLLAGLQAVA